MPIDEVVEGVAGEVADNLEELAQATRRINPNSVGGLVIGLAIGAAVGFYFGHRWNTEKLRAEAFRESEAEVDKIREIYREGTRIVDEEKPSVEEIVAEKGYLTDDEEKPATKKPKKPAAKKPKRPLRAPVPVRETLHRPEDPRPDPEEQVKLVVEGDWDYAAEIASRSEEHPYVINQRERGETDSPYASVTYTYYAVDDVLVDDEDNHPLPHADLIVGQDNLKFGHGSDDENVVFVRNDRLETEMEICRVNRSYEEEVLGLDSNEPT